MVQGGGFEPPKLARQIYSLIPLATREPLRKEAGILRLTSHFVNHFPLGITGLANKSQGNFWSWREESNPRPADYKSAALPTELRQHHLTRSRTLVAMLCGGAILVKLLQGCNIWAVILFVGYFIQPIEQISPRFRTQ